MIKTKILNNLKNAINKSVYFKNSGDCSYNLKIYGDIDEWMAEGSDIYNNISKIPDNSSITININSCGGDMDTAFTMYNLLKDKKINHGVKINVYIDGFACSAASYFPLLADNLYFYNNSVYMIHLPKTYFQDMTDIDDLKSEINALQILEDNMYNMYLPFLATEMTKDEFHTVLKNEKWMNYQEFVNFFKIPVTLIDSVQNKAIITNKTDLESIKDENIKKSYEDLINQYANNNIKSKEKLISLKFKQLTL